VAYQDMWIGTPQIGRWFSLHQIAIRYASTSIVLFATVFVLAAELKSNKPSFPRTLYVVGLAAMVLLALEPRSPFLYLVVWTSQHWMVAVGLASQTPRRPSAVSGIASRILHSLNARSWAIVGILAVISITFLPFFEVEANWGGGPYYGERLFGSMAVSLRDSSWAPLLLSVGFATGFVHYILDRNVYRMSDPRVRSAARSLLEP